VRVDVEMGGVEPPVINFQSPMCFPHWGGHALSYRLVLNLSRQSHITPALQQLHWLPVQYCITFKIAALMHRILLGQCPPYLADLVTFSADDTHRRRLRSSTNRAAIIQRTKI